MFIVLLGFTNSFFIIARTQEGEEEKFTTDNFYTAVMYTWRNGLGEFETDLYEESEYNVLIFIIWILCTFFILILFLNLLIAVLSDSFDKIQETLDNNLLKEMAIMMSENEVFINRKRVFKGMKYLFIIDKTSNTYKPDKWGGRLDYVNKIIKKTKDIHIRLMNRIVEDIRFKFSEILKTRLGKFLQTTNKSMNHLEDRVDKLEANMGIYKDLYKVAFKKK